MHRNQVKSGHLKHGARFTKYLTAILRLSCDNVKDAIDVRRTSIICGFDDCGSILDRVLMLLTSVVGDAAIHLIVQTMRLWSQLKEFFYISSVMPMYVARHASCETERQTRLSQFFARWMGRVREGVWGTKVRRYS